ncbi:MAG: TIGR03905 family TSCPD domain-containing protein [Anaeroplasmataceae bacterium]|nr:TIGR03905 family TSCPD domain-containing protein [Anaeroplasmataceae bacterium]
MNYTYETKGTCSKKITFELDEQGNLHNVAFMGGCNGNLKAISKLVEGKPADEVVQILEGNTCGPRATSCADQLAKAILEARNA